MKENDHPLYVNSNSNHPPLVLKNIPLGVNRRLSKISADKNIFDAAIPPYQEALSRSGYDHILEYIPDQDFTTKKKNRRRSVTWFNPPFSMNVRSNVGKEFLSLLDRAFPPSNPLHKLFTRQTVKISYKRMPNMAQAVAGHNTKVLNGDRQPDQQPGCNCQGGPGTCPVQGKCLTRCVVYEAAVEQIPSGKTETYTGVTARSFKARLYEHRADMNKESSRIKSTLAAHVWDLKDEHIQYKVSWKLKDRATDFNPVTKKCRVCLKEKYHIMYKTDGSTLNSRSEVFNTCRHRKQKLLEKAKT